MPMIAPRSPRPLPRSLPPLGCGAWAKAGIAVKTTANRLRPRRIKLSFIDSPLKVICPKDARWSRSVLLRLQNNCDARFALHILGDCKLHAAVAVSTDDETGFERR